MHLFEVPGAAAATTDPAAWTFHIFGRIIDPSPQPAGTPAPPLGQPRPPAAQALSYYVRRLRVELDPAQYPGPEGTVAWERAQHVGAHCESFQIK